MTAKDLLECTFKVRSKGTPSFNGSSLVAQMVKNLPAVWKIWV